MIPRVRSPVFHKLGMVACVFGSGVWEGQELKAELGHMRPCLKKSGRGRI